MHHRFLTAAGLWLGTLLPAAAQHHFVSLTPYDPDLIRKAATVTPTPRQFRWQQLELTAFFHFGVNTFTDREWGDGTESPSIFNPTELDARQWVRTCRDAGIRQVILTAKHHDGFCLWPTATTGHSVQNSPWKQGKGDVVREVADACREYGVGFGVYLSPWDRNAPSYGTAAYNDLFVNQLTELLTKYGKVDEVWFDGANGEGPNGKKQEYDFPRWYKLIRKLQPEAVIAIMGPDVRWVGTETGYGRETEWSVVPANNLDQDAIAGNSQKDLLIKPVGYVNKGDLGGRETIAKAKGLAWYPAETDVSIRPGWFYHDKEDDKVKSPEKLTDIYFHSVGKNGVLLLNIPPDRRGLIADADIRSLKGWKAGRDQIFRENFLKKSTAFPQLTDGRYDTFWTGTDTTATLEFDLKSPQTFSVLSLQENIRVGQRIEQFVLEVPEGSGWKEVAKGTTVGYKRLLRFPAVTAGKVRLRILSSRLQPTLTEMGVY